MTLREMLDAVVRRRALVLSVMIGALVFGGMVIARQGTSYASEAQVLLTQPQVLDPGIDGQATQQKLVLQAVTVASLVSARDFVLEAARVAGVDASTASVSAMAPLNTALVKITATSANRDSSAKVAQAVVDRLRSSVGLATSAPQGGQPIQAVEVQHPQTMRSSANPIFTLFAVLCAGFVLAVVVVLLLEER